MDSRRLSSRTKPKPKIPPLDKKIRPNPKYENIRSSIDTGNNTRKQVERMEEIRQYYKFRPDEIFRRITVTSMVTLMLEVSKLEFQEEDSHRLDNQIREDQESLLLNGDQKVEEKANEVLEDEGQNDLHEEEEKEAAEEGLEVDSLDSAIDPEEHRRSQDLDDDPDMIDSIVFKGKKIRKGGGFNSHHFSSVGNLLQGIGQVEISPRTINDMSDRNYHHSDSTKAASTFQLDNPPPIEPTLPSKQNDPKVPNFSHESDNSESSSKISMKKRERPYLILDIRDAEAFKKARIVTSKSYPAPRLSRSVNYESKDMLKYKNIQGKLIIVVDSDESMAAKFATTLIQRGYDNVFVLSGGLRVAKIKFPEQLITPLTCYDLDDQDDYDEQVDEDQIHVLEAFLEEAMTHGTSRMSTSTKSGWPSRISSSQSNLPSLINQEIKHKARQVPLGVNYYPPRPQRTSFSTRRS